MGEGVTAVDSKKQYFASLTGARAVFMMVVILYHTNAMFGSPFSSHIVPRVFYEYGGYLGNYFFFMLSGFLMAYSYRDRILNGEICLKDFAKKRLLKLYPLYLLSQLAQLALMIWAYGISVFNVKEFVVNLLMMTTVWADNASPAPYNAACWFACAILLCDLIYYIICTCSKKNLEKYVVLCVMLTLWGYILQNRAWNFPFSYLQNGEAFFNFFGGCVLYEVYISISETAKKRIARLGMVIMILLCIFAVNVGVSAAFGNVTFVITVVICPLVIVSSIHLKWLHQLLCWKPIQFCGKITLSMFFWHLPLSTLVSILRNNHLYFPNCSGTIQYLFYFLILILFSSLSHFLLEMDRVKGCLQRGS